MPDKTSSTRPRATAQVKPDASAQDNPWTWLILILALAAVLRLYALGSVPHGFSNDEAQDGLNARQAVVEGPRVFYPENNGREGLYINLSAPLVRILGDTIWAMRLPSAIFGVLTVWLTYLLGAELFSKRTGLLGALFVATSTWHLFNSRLSNRANAAPFFLAWALYLTFQTVKRIRGGQSYLAWALLAGAVYGLGFHSYPSFRLTPVLMLGVWIYFLAKERASTLWKRLWLAAACFGSAATLVITPLVLFFWNHPEMLSKRAGQVSVFSAPDPWLRIVRNCWAVAQMFFWRGDTDWKNNLSGQRELFLPVALLFAAGVGVALLAIWRGIDGQGGKAFPHALMLGWMAVGAAACIPTLDEIHALRLSLMIPPVFLIAGVGAQRIYRWLERTMPRGVVLTVAACFVFAVCYEPLQTYFQDWADNVNVPRTFYAWLTDEATEIRDALREPAKFVAIPNGIWSSREVPQVIKYLTRTATARECEEANIHYLFPDEKTPMSDLDFCAKVKREHPREQVFCVAVDLPLRPQ